MIRKAEMKDLPQLCALYEKARQFMRQTGNLYQWNDGHPAWSDLSEDIENGILYCMEVDGSIEASFVFYIGEDPTYLEIDGAWPSAKTYAAVHKVASRGQVPGMGKAILDWCKKAWPILRMDTHEDNKVMQHLLVREGFVYAGVIRLANGDPRLAYQFTGR